MNAHVTPLLSPPRDGTLVVRSPGYLLLTGTLRLAGAAALLVAAVAPGLGGGIPVRLLLGVAAAAVAAIAVRTFAAGVYLEGDGVLVRNPLRSRRLRWDEIDDVAPRRGTPLVWLVLRGGKRIPLCSWGWPSPAAREGMTTLLWAARPGRAA